MTWVQLEKCNDWGIDYFAIKGEGLRGGQTADHGRGIRFGNWQHLTLKGPLGAVNKEVVVVESTPSTYSDHGHRYECFIKHLAVQVMYHGMVGTARVDLKNYWFDEDEIRALGLRGDSPVTKEMAEEIVEWL